MNPDRTALERAAADAQRILDAVSRSIDKPQAELLADVAHELAACYAALERHAR